MEAGKERKRRRKKAEDDPEEAPVPKKKKYRKDKRELESCLDARSISAALFSLG